MKFNKLVSKILEDFNIFPQNQTAPSTGPDTGMTKGDNNNTFPSSETTLKIPWPKKRKTKKKLNHPKETQSTQKA